MTRKAYYLDMLERVFWTFLQAFGGVFLGIETLPEQAARFASESGLQWRAALFAAAIAIFKTVLAPALPWTARGTGSTLPASVEPPAPPHRSTGDGGYIDRTFLHVLVVLAGIVLLIILIT